MQPDWPRIVVTHWVHKPVLDLLASQGQVIANDTRERWTQDELVNRARDATAMLAFMPDRIDEAFLQACPRLKIVAAELKGYDNIDVEACTQRGVWVSIVPDLLTEPTAELAIALLLGLIRNVLPGDRSVRSGGFRGWRPVLYGATLGGATLGIIGMGAVGRAIARKLPAFGSSVVYHDSEPLDPDAAKTLRAACARELSLEALLARADMLIVAAPLTTGSQHMLDDRRLRRLRRGAYVVNIGRGSVVSEQAVTDLLREGHLAGYAADVFELEDLSRHDRPTGVPAALLTQADKTLFTPHLGSAVDSARRDIAFEAAHCILDALDGRTPRHAVNGDECAVRQRTMGT